MLPWLTVGIFYTARQPVPVVIGGPATTIAGNLVFATVLNESPTSEWIGINVFNPVDGDPLVGNPAADFNFTVDGLTMTGQALFDNSFAQVVHRHFTGADPGLLWRLCQRRKRQSDLGTWPGHGGNAFTPGPAQTSYSFDPVIFVNPYSFVTAGGIPVTADRVEELLHFMLAEAPPPTGAPEPAGLALLGVGLLGLLAVRRRA